MKNNIIPLIAIFINDFSKDFDIHNYINIFPTNFFTIISSFKFDV